ncbi:MAG TPA: hypothetical protein VJW20_04370 [Candidatus Angelobacter sp.]|nr:hypothetical protein [Candidatus Angelobacter sp.]
MPDEFNNIPPLDPEGLRQIVEKKATCPFVGSAVAMQRLPVRYRADNPLASIEDVRALGNSGGGDLGDVLAIFASGNHNFMLGADGQLDRKAPQGLFSLEFPGSQGSHPGHSGILQADPRQLGSGRFSQADFQRLAGRVREGFITRSDVAKFIAENLHRDQNSKVFGTAVLKALGHDLAHFVESLGPFLLAEVHRAGPLSDAHRSLEEKFTKLTGEDNLAGSCGEFGLLFAFLANRPGAREIDGEPVLLLEDLQLMFVEKRIPEGWESWKKTRIDWLTNSTALMISAGKAYLARGAAT